MAIETTFCDFARQFSFLKTMATINAISVTDFRIRIHSFDFNGKSFQFTIEKEEGVWKKLYRLWPAGIELLVLEDVAIATALSDIIQMSA